MKQERGAHLHNTCKLSTQHRKFKTMEDKTKIHHQPWDIYQQDKSPKTPPNTLPNQNTKMHPFDQYKIPYKIYKNFLIWFCEQLPSFKTSDFYKFFMEEQQTFSRLAGFVWGAVAVFRLLLGWGWTGEIRGGAAPMTCGWIWTWPSCATALEGWILFFLIRAWLIPTYTKFQMILHYAPTHANTSTYKQV